jgi:drug/metabolite transporter (DMT)-like permease
MLTVVLGLGSSLGYVLHDFLMIKVVRAVAVWTAMCWSMGVGLVVLVPLALLLYGPPAGSTEWRATAFAVAGGLCEAAALACLLRGLVTGNLSIVTPLASLAGGIVAIIAVAGGEPLTRPAMIGLPLAVAGGLLASVERTPAGESSRPDADAGVGDGAAADIGAVVLLAAAPAAGDARLAVTTAPGGGIGAAGAESPAAGVARRRRRTAGAGWALLSSALFAVVILLLDEATALPSVAIAAYGRVGTMIVLVPVALLLAGLWLPRRFRGRCLLAGLADSAAFILFAGAITIGPLAVASVVISQGGTLAVVLGYFALRERLSGVQYVGVACTCAACTLFALS